MLKEILCTLGPASMDEQIISKSADAVQMRVLDGGRVGSDRAGSVDDSERAVAMFENGTFFRFYTPST